MCVFFCWNMKMSAVSHPTGSRALQYVACRSAGEGRGSGMMPVHYKVAGYDVVTAETISGSGGRDPVDTGKGGSGR